MTLFVFLSFHNANKMCTYLSSWKSGCSHICDGMVCNCTFLYMENHSMRGYILQSSQTDILCNLREIYVLEYSILCLYTYKINVNFSFFIYHMPWKKCTTVLFRVYIRVYLFIIYIVVVIDLKDNQYFIKTVNRWNFDR